MSVIAWDGLSIAADRAATVDNDCLITVTKLYRLETGEVVGFTGTHDDGLALKVWFEEGANPALLPKWQSEKDEWQRLIVAKGRRVYVLEQRGVEVEIERAPMAWGCGRNFALGAMSMGATAFQAVKIASRWSPFCGLGVDVFELATDDPEYKLKDYRC